ncbi:EAL domain-containing protein [Pontibacillus sp. HMF3514]|uniref:EAL domain-containing protein n=1 Tax=Pontibacillus sp. HMF3514 TaxID=2692425 RepID=UPI00131FA621|nr:EAL domain-containing protein [Pontibacillus sp. HMF3514]QHE54002.1 EAL domain-containing protein [Pontibacillus sp. HMF3514]
MNIFELLKKNNLFHFYQPIYHLEDNQLFGYEALLRSDYLKSPAHLFKVAMKSNILYHLDTTSIEKALSIYRKQHQQEKLFLNVFISTLLNPNFVEFMEKLLLHAPQNAPKIVFEMNEAIEEEEMWASSILLERVAIFRSMGIEFAIDDFGQGTASLRNTLEIEPEYLKLDRFFAHNLGTSEKKQRLISLFTEYFNKDTTVVLEGIETASDLQTASDLGIDIAQGYYLGKPAEIVS